MSKQLTKEMIEAFVMHPDWPFMLDFITSHYEPSADIQGIDTTRPAETVVGEIIASQKMDTCNKNLRDTFHNLRKNHGKTKVTYE